ncbi:hypothetical protein ACFCX0_03800 [Streptomyces sp. NPDC056352]|uniref:hypothetical protein n=1 Tax=Streptomyces sp. NPDC056352 TaxID=3345791 RepID=UPI0035DBA958
MPEQTTRLAEIEARDTQILRAASSDSDDWDDDTWAAWFRTAERVHGDGVSRTPLFDKVGAQQARIAELETELAKYVGKEPTIADEMAYLQRCLNDVYEVCDQAEKQATRWEQPLPVPEWVATVREAADGERPDNPNDKRRRLYVDGKGNAWIDGATDDDGTRYVIEVEGPVGEEQPVETIRANTGSLREIGRCW